MDRIVTLSPLEIGKAFGAPLLIQLSSGQEVEEIIASCGNRRVKYDGQTITRSNSFSTFARLEEGEEIEMEFPRTRFYQVP